MSVTIHTGHVLDKLRELPDESVNCCVTSPPYWGLRDYGTPAQVWGGVLECVHEWGGQIAAAGSRSNDEKPGKLQSDANTGRAKRPASNICSRCGAWRGHFGLEPTPEMFITHMVEIFHEVRRVLRKDGTLWLNIGDSYASGKGTCYNPGGNTSSLNVHLKAANVHPLDRGNKSTLAASGLKPKDLVGIPWMAAFALRTDGWYLRQDIIWHKPNPMPESVTDRCTKSHEYIFLLIKSAKYHYDGNAIKERCKDSSVARLGQDIENQLGGDRVPGKTNGRMKAVKFGGNKQCPDTRLQSGKTWDPKQGGGGTGFDGHSGNRHADGTPYILSNKRSVWSVTTLGFKEAHFATFPPNLIKPCILAGCPQGGVVLDPFGGSGTTGMVALELGRKAVLIELNPEYVKLIHQRTDVTMGLRL